MYFSGHPWSLSPLIELYGGFERPDHHPADPTSFEVLIDRFADFVGEVAIDIIR
jgi:hypothetical protein